MNSRRQITRVVGLCALVALATTAAACGGNSPSSTRSTPPPSATTSAPAATSSPATSPPSSTSGAAAAISANFETFFNSKTSVAKRVSLLQDGSQFAAIITAQQHNPLAAGLTAKVKSVSNITSSQADVKYDLVVSGAKVPMTGTAVNEGGTWKVGVATFCGLLHLEALKHLPAVCSAV
jgi:DNA polymerase III gamma/tau subunit